MLLLLAVTKFGWAFIVSIIVSIWMTKAVLKRMLPGKNLGCVSFGYVGLIISILMLMVLTFSVVIAESIYGLYNKPSYEATVVSYTSNWEEISEQDSDGRSQTRSVLMHNATVRFKDNDGNFVELKTNISSGKEPIIGSKIKIVYEPGDESANEFSFRSISLLCGGILMIFLMGFSLFAAFYYALGKDMSGIKSFGTAILIRFLIPMAMLFMLSVLGYVLYLYFIGEKSDMPGWALAVCIFFCLVLALSLPAYFKMAFSKNPGELMNNTIEESEEKDEDEYEDFEDKLLNENKEHVNPISKNRSTPLD